MSFRKLATVRTVTNISPIEGADAIEVATVDSWKVVVRKGEVSVGSLVVYFEIDSWIPTKLAPFLSKSPKTYQGISGEKLKTIRLRGQISQGLIMNVSEVVDFKVEEGQDLTEILGIIKWEPEQSSVPGQSAPKGNFPSFIPKTDQERIQNLTKKFSRITSELWEVTEKYDGSSMTVYTKNGEEVKEGVCSRNLDLEMDSENFFWNVAIREKLLEKLRECGLNIALQGELVGAKIGQNIYKLENKDFWLFDIYDISSGTYFTPEHRQEFAKKYNIKHVPVLFNNFKIESNIDDLLKFAEGKSVLNPKVEREGLVFKNTKLNEINSFKVISNNFLLKN